MPARARPGSSTCCSARCRPRCCSTASRCCLALPGLQKALAAAPPSPVALLGVALLIAGFGFKMAVVPFQMWVPDVYQGAPTPVTAFLSVASKGAGFAVALRVFHSAFGYPPVMADWSMIFALISAVSMTIGNVVAIQQQNIKRMMGYS